MKPIIYFLFIFFSLNIFSQNNESSYILVQITLTNKMKEEKPAVGVEVKSPDANDGFTNEYGEFKLEFPTKNIGDLVRINIGETDDIQQAIKLVNSSALKEVAILNRPDDHPLRLIVCRPEDYSACFNRFYPYLKPITEEIEKEITDNQNEMDSGNKSPEQTFKLKQKIANLKAELKSKQELIAQMAGTLSNIGKGGSANPSENPGFGIGLDGKINYKVLLDDENLDNSYNDAINQKIAFQNEINRIITKHKGKAYAYQKDSVFDKSAENYVRVCEILEENNFDSKLLIGAYRDAALSYFDNGEYTKSGVYYQKAIYTILSDPKANKITLANLYNGLANTYKSNKNYEWAINSYQDGVDVIVEHYGESSRDLLFPYHGIALCYQSLNRIEKAEQYYLKSIDIIGHDSQASVSDILNTFNNAINFYKNTDQPNKAADLYGKSIDKIGNQVGSNNPMLIKLLTEMSDMLRLAGEYEESMEKVDHALDIIAQKNGEKSPQYRNTLIKKNKIIIDRANNYIDDERYDEAITDFTNLILKKGEATYYMQRAICFYYLDNFPRALEDLRAAKKTSSSIVNTDYYSWLGLTQIKSGNRKDAENALLNYRKIRPGEGSEEMSWAAYFAIRNKKEDALDRFKKAIEKGYQNINWINKEKGFDSIRNELEFQSQLKRLEAKNQ